MILRIKTFVTFNLVSFQLRVPGSNNDAVFLDFGYFFHHQPFSGCFEVRSTLLIESLLAEKSYFHFIRDRVPVARTQISFFSPRESTD